MAELAVETAPAKVNLALHVTGRRPDGLHNLQSLVVFAGVGDELVARSAEVDGLKVKGPFAGQLTPGQVNLVSRAVSAFRQNWPEAAPEPIEITLTKNLPVSAGIGGGSADAAAALRLMTRLGGKEIVASELATCAADLGADVPVCLFSQSCLMTGVGDQLAPVPLLPDAHLLLINPLKPIATADIFRQLVSRDNPVLPDIPDPVSNLAMLGLWLQETRNDLQQTATLLLPEVKTIIDAVSDTQGNVLSRMSGSGATVFGLYGSAALAHQAAQDMRANFPDYWVSAAPIL